MICSKCGNENNEGNAFCIHCGEKLMVEEIASEKKVKQKHTTSLGKDILLGVDNKYRWNYGMNMWKNPTVLLTVWKVFMLSGLVVAIFVAAISTYEGGIAEGARVFLGMGAILIVAVTGLILIAYPIVAIINGGTYQVVFELNEKGIKLIQMQKQFEKNQVVFMIGVLAGIAAGNPTVTGSSLLAGSKQSLYSEFKKVRKIVIKRKRHVIYVNERLIKNQVYVEDKNFEAVCDYIVDHCKKAKVLKK